jgi:hypothetical protein
MAADIEVIWVNREAEYFCKWDWTAQISLIRLNKFAAQLRWVNQNQKRTVGERPLLAQSGHSARRASRLSASSGSPSSPSIARHALAGVRARDDGELAFESRSEQDAAERHPIWSNRWEADFRRRHPIYSTVTINLLKPRRMLFSARSSTSTWKRVTLRASAVNSARISSLARFMPRHAWGPAPNAM